MAVLTSKCRRLQGEDLELKIGTLRSATDFKFHSAVEFEFGSVIIGLARLWANNKALTVWLAGWLARGIGAISNFRFRSA